MVAHESLKTWLALDPIDLSPFLPSWNLHKVELFSAFYITLRWYFKLYMFMKCKSLQFERKKIYMKDNRIRTHDLDGPIYAKH